MSNRIAVACQYTNGTKPCGNRTTNPTGLCPQHKRSVPLKDIHEGTGKKPLMTAIPRVGPVVASSASYTTDQPASNEEMAEKLLETKKKEDSFRAWLVRMFAPTPKLASRPTAYYSGGGSSSSGSDSDSSASSSSVSMDATNIAVGMFD